MLDNTIKWGGTIAVSTYIGRSAMILPWLPTLVLILAGSILGAISALIALSYWFHKLTKLPEAHQIDDTAHPQRVRTTHKAGRDVTVGGHTLPAPFTFHGKFSGPVFTASVNQWDRTDYIEDWPPRGPKFLAWNASLNGGTLVLDLLPPKSVHKHKKGKKHQEHSSQTETGNVEAWKPRKVGIPLDGCTVEIVMESLHGRSEMNRRCPLFISHPNWTLLDGERGFYLFSHDFAAKQQWYHGLKYWCQGSERMRKVEKQYKEYCMKMNDVTLLPFARESEVVHEGGSGLPPLSAHAGDHHDTSSRLSITAEKIQPQAPDKTSKKATWKSWGTAKMHSAKQQYSAWKNEQRGTGETTSQQQPASAATNVPDIDSIIEQRWMQSRKIPVPSVPKKDGKTGESTSLPTSPVKPPPAWPATNQVDAAANGAGTSGYTTPAGGMSPVKQPPLPASPTKAPNASVSDKAALPSSSTQPSLSNLPPGFPTPISIDHGVNMLLTRTGFDLLRSPVFQEYLRTRIQRNLSRLKTPDYVQQLEVISVDAGTTAPTVKNIAALPMPDGTVWPQLLCDFKYQGAFKITIGCKVDIRDAPAWNALDRAISKVEGTSKKPRVSPSGPELAASEDYDMAAEDEDDEYEGEVGQEGEPEDEEEEDQSTSSSSSPTEGKDNHAGGRKAFIDTLRHSTANRLRKLAETTATHIANMPLRIDLTFTALEGTLALWLPPPPGDRFFYSFVTAPKLEVHAQPQLSGRLLKFSYHASRASKWIEARMALAFTKNMIYPASGDIPVPLLLLDADNPFLNQPLGGSVLDKHGEHHSEAASDDHNHAEKEDHDKQEEDDAQKRKSDDMKQQDDDGSRKAVEVARHERNVTVSKVLEPSGSYGAGNNVSVQPFLEVRLGRRDNV